MELHKQQIMGTLLKKITAVALTASAALLLLGSIALVAPLAVVAAEKQYLPSAPANPTIHQVYYNTTVKCEYIYNGQEWVPHDASINGYILKKYKKPNPPQNNPTAAGNSLQ
ncbi:hypothetical protein [Citrifermentans bremense]|uniref:hypothetical protein n=1 Tax=Citrifermentans bremense TaxID=60035 RepID=UPI0012EB4266|nr:hypothetical protein [Citrifermentans bremense]